MAILGRPKVLSRLPTLGSSTSKQEHMQRRKADGLSHREVGEEFGVSKSTSHRWTGTPRGQQGQDQPGADDSIPD